MEKFYYVQVCVYKIHSEPVSILKHACRFQKEKEKESQSYFDINYYPLEQKICTMKIHLLMQSSAFIIQLKCEGMETDFMFRPHRVNLAQSRRSKLQ